MRNLNQIEIYHKDLKEFNYGDLNDIYYDYSSDILCYDYQNKLFKTYHSNKFDNFLIKDFLKNKKFNRKNYR